MKKKIKINWNNQKWIIRDADELAVGTLYLSLKQ